MNREQLFKKRPWIVAWGQKMGSYGYYIEAQCRKAEEDKAPEDAIFRREGYEPDGKYHVRGWAVIGDNKHLRAELMDYREGRRGGIIIN